MERHEQRPNCPITRRLGGAMGGCAAKFSNQSAAITHYTCAHTLIETILWLNLKLLNDNWAQWEVYLKITLLLIRFISQQYNIWFKQATHLKYSNTLFVLCIRQTHIGIKIATSMVHNKTKNKNVDLQYTFTNKEKTKM